MIIPRRQRRSRTVRGIASRSNRDVVVAVDAPLRPRIVKGSVTRVVDRVAGLSSVAAVLAGDDAAFCLAQPDALIKLERFAKK